MNETDGWESMEEDYWTKKDQYMCFFRALAAHQIAILDIEELLSCLAAARNRLEEATKEIDNLTKSLGVNIKEHGR